MGGKKGAGRVEGTGLVGTKVEVEEKEEDRLNRRRNSAEGKGDQELEKD